MWSNVCNPQKFMCTASLILLLGVAAGVANADLRSGLVGYYPLNEGTGTIAHDMSGNGHDGTLYNGVTWISPGYIGGGVNDNGTADSRIDLGTWNPAEGTGKLSLVMWIRWSGSTATYQGLLGKRNTWPGTTMFQFQVRPENGGTFRLETGSAAIVSPSNTLNPLVHTWVHVAATFDGTTARLYLNGNQVASGAFAFQMAGTGSMMGIGSVTGGGAGVDGDGQTFSGDMDEVGIFNRALAADEVALAMLGLGGDKAAGPRPQDKTTDVPRDAVLGWDPVKTAATRDVYLGTAYADVNLASRANPGKILVSQGQTPTTFAPVGLAYGQTYYWRIDEVNGTPDATVFKGDIWSFTAEPFAYPIKGVKAKASSQLPSAPASKTVDSSGLTTDPDGNLVHNTTNTNMWMSNGKTPTNWIQYEFDVPYKLDKLWVWNSNYAGEPDLGFGAKNVTIDYSVDGVTWTTLAGVPEFAQAIGDVGYMANTIVDFGGATAKIVKLTINESYGGGLMTGLSEVRFFSIPVQAREPQPADAATGVSAATDLTWRPGREAGSHQVFLGADPNAVAQGTVTAQIAADHSFTPASLVYGTKYYWRVDEVNTTTYPGNVWSFTTQDYAAFDDFENYNDVDRLIYDSWRDNFDPQGDQSGSIVGNEKAPWAEQVNVHSGRQAMPLRYNNAGPKYLYSETGRDLDSPADWTDHGADSLRLYVRGSACGFLETGTGEIIMNAVGTDIWNGSDQFRYAYKNLSGDGSMTVRVNSLIRTDGWAKAGVMIRESTHPTSKFVMVCLTPDFGVSYQQRSEAGITPSQVSTSVVVSSAWVKLTRKGNAFTAQYSADGVTWKDIAFTTPVSVSMAAGVSIGLALTSHNTNLAVVTGAEFSNVSTTGNVTGSWQVEGIGADQPAGNAVAPMYVRIEDSSGGRATVKNADEIITIRPMWREWVIPYSDLAGVNLSRVKKMCIGVGDRNAPTAGGSGTVYLDDIALGRSLAR